MVVYLLAVPVDTDSSTLVRRFDAIRHRSGGKGELGRTMKLHMGLASVVTQSLVSEFELMKSTFEQHHSALYHWHLRVDHASFEALKHHDNIELTVFSETIQNRVDAHSSLFREIVAQKMNAIEDAFKYSNYNGVAFMDADLITLAPFFESICSERAEEDLLLSPHYYPEVMRCLENTYGIYNSGFLIVFNPSFSEWWRHAFLEQPELFADQACLNAVGAAFKVKALNRQINVGFWRSIEGYLGEFKFQPDECKLLHLHLFRPIHSQAELSENSLALTCLSTRVSTQDPNSLALFRKILEFDKTGFYRYVFNRFFDPNRPDSFVRRLETAVQNSEIDLSTYDRYL